ncbi:MAG: FliM/FliN family flagellar motor switch protein [Janthinobacterium lividum]
MRSTDPFHADAHADAYADTAQIAEAVSPTPRAPLTFDQAIDRLRLPMTVLAGRASLSVAQIDALQVGAIVELDATSEHCVELVVNQHTIAVGRLVQVDQRLAVQVLRLKRNHIDRP